MAYKMTVNVDIGAMDEVLPYKMVNELHSYARKTMTPIKTL
jgi:hypothetical protein